MDDPHEMSNLPKSGQTSIRRIEAMTCANKDTLQLAKTGKRQVLERRFGLVSMVGFSCSLMLTWEGATIFFETGLQNGGPAGVVYGYLLAWIGTLSVFVCMGELASMLPSAGGQYHWTSILAPPPAKRFLSYVTGWVNIAAWVAAPTATSFFSATLIQGVLAQNYPDYSPNPWQALLLMLAGLVFCTALNTLFGKALPAIEVLTLILHITGFFAVVIPLVYLAPTKNGGHEVFATFINGGEWPTQTLSFFVGLQGNAAAFLGTDGAIHMAEEVGNSAINVPRSMMISLLINGSLGFAMVLAMLFTAGDYMTLLESDSDFPFMQIFESAMGKSGATTLIAIMIILNGCSIIAALSSASRMMWSFSREQAMPGWRFLRKINHHTSIPTHTVYVTVLVAALLGLIQLGSSTVLNDVLSLMLEGFYSSYLIALSLLLYRRLRGEISEPADDTGMVPYDKLMSVSATTWGPWRVKGWVGTANNMLAIVYLIVVGFFCFWPPDAATTAENMNYSCVVLGAVAIGSMLYYYGWARKQYRGPVVEVEVLRE